MNFLFDLGHPGHVHFFRQAAAILAGRGHGVTSLGANYYNIDSCLRPCLLR